jgi:DNA-binding IclR family transcriptional regulator
MARPALAATRAIDILNFITNQPGHEFTLSEFVQRLEINIASCHAILNTLTENGYLVRHPTHKTYTLGPALIATGQAAQERHPAIGIARTEAAKLSAETNLEVVVSARLGKDMVGLAHYGKLDFSAPIIQVGQHVPLIPPLGAVFMAWSNSDQVEAWLKKSPRTIAKSERDKYHELLATIKNRGYAVYLENAVPIELGEAAREISFSNSSPRDRAMMTKLIGKLDIDAHYLIRPKSGKRYQVRLLSAPIFNRHGVVAYAIYLSGFGEELSTEEIQMYVKKLTACCRSVTVQSNGKWS